MLPEDNPVNVGRPVPIVWKDVESSPLVFANSVLVQHTEHEFILVFGYIQPPVVLRDEDADAIKEVAAHVLFRVALTPSRMPDVIRALESNYKKFATKHGMVYVRESDEGE